MKIYNHQLEKLIVFLHSLELERKDSRMRTRFKNLLIDKLQTVMDETVEINKQYIAHDENNQPIKENGDYLIKDNVKRVADINELMNEAYEVPQDINNREMLLSIKDSVLNHSPATFKGDEADTYDMVCELVEQIEYE
ncbi:hypothetical protein HUB98_06405 [Paenibacillus barcinonensis]|uniref:DUF1617 family protein n=1 Tax=Paenibacillus barcinonensis TaxID=198119 RepID=A0A2V4WTG5_PAEBA|nr:hypothetical protein [Paenibacillus barcinonensis]PYE51649.1 hypothetical protein DFQ00_102444 [Paenibacillus barcinonensis]QKS56010.1 hypothetical protein HUB98_06405 [Paenibacillus barcinonensis]